MSGRYTISLSGLKEGRHTIDFEIDNEFFDKFEESEVKEGSLNATVVIDKNATHSDLMIRISGNVRLCCDRCLEMFSHHVACENRLLIKFGKNFEDSDPDILFLPAGEQELDIQQHLYEFIMLALPIRRVHPNDSKGRSTCDPVMMKKLDELIVDEGVQADPRWDELKKLINDN